MNRWKPSVGWGACFLLLASAVVAALGCRLSDNGIQDKSKPAGAGIEEVWDVPYTVEAKKDPFRHRLDMFLPAGKKDYPVVMLVHGGAWVVGDNRSGGLYTAVGRFLASQGIGAVLPNYRLSPAVKHPEHIKDVAKALAWTRINIGKFGGNPDRMFIMGHSAGGHLVSLLATDEKYLQAEGLKSADIKGVISVSGVYSIPQGIMEFTFGGTGPLAFRADQVLPIRGESSATPPPPAAGTPGKLNIFGPMFGNDPKLREQASPIHFVRRDLPPFLILIADRDLPTLPGMADDFHKALLREGCDARLLKMERRNHNSLMFTATRADDPAAREILEFIRTHDPKK